MKILTLNVFMRPMCINSYFNSIKSYWNGNIFFKDIFKGDFKNDRFNKLLDIIREKKYDIICLQELFSDGITTRVSKIKSFSAKNNYYLYFPLDIKMCKSFTTSGLCILSKYPIIESNFIEYKTSIFFPNVLSNCGFQHIKIKNNNKVINLINLHLQSGFSEKQNNIRYNQINEIYDYLEKRNIKKENIIITGDFNANLKLWKYINKKFESFKDPFENTMLNDAYTFKYFGKNEIQRFDGIIYNFPDLDYKELKSIIDPIKIDKIGYFENISDHYGIVTEIN